MSYELVLASKHFSTTVCYYILESSVVRTTLYYYECNY